MRGRAAPWLAPPGRADRNSRIIARLFQLDKPASPAPPPAQLSVLPGDAGWGTRLMALSQTTGSGGGPSRDRQPRSARDSGSSGNYMPLCSKINVSLLRPKSISVSVLVLALVVSI